MVGSRHVPGPTPEANDLLERNPLALLIGMLLDQQIVVRTLATVEVPQGS